MISSNSQKTPKTTSKFKTRDWNAQRHKCSGKYKKTPHWTLEVPLANSQYSYCPPMNQKQLRYLYVIMKAHRATFRSMVYKQQNSKKFSGGRGEANPQADNAQTDWWRRPKLRGYWIIIPLEVWFMKQNWRMGTSAHCFFSIYTMHTLARRRTIVTVKACEINSWCSNTNARN